MIKDFTPRLYQQTILATCANYNTLVVLPTGLGKTNIFLMLASQRLMQYPDSKVLFVGPTRPLIEQYYSVFKKHFNIDEDKIAVFTGMISPDKRAELWKKSQVIFSTPQGLENDIISDKIDISSVSLLGIDEAHRSVGDYSTVFIAKQYNKKSQWPRILALTASPGSDFEKINEVCKNLFIEKIEVRTDKDPDVKPYIQDVSVEWVEVELPHSFMQIKKFLEASFKSKIDEIKKYGYITSIKNFNKRELLRMQGQLHSEVAKGNKDYEILKSISLIAESIKVQHALELLETQGITALYEYFQKINEEARKTKVKAVINLVNDLNFRSAYMQTRNMYEAGVEHPKLKKLKDILTENMKDDVKIIVFNQYRDSGSRIVDEINSIDGIKAELFVGQMKKKDTGLSQKEQREMLERFRSGEFNVLVATSVGEEGLDIPAVDLVIFYEPVPSAIRTVQRRGRTGRQEQGRVIVLVSKDTRDVGYRWSAHHKEKRMYRILEKLKDKFTGFEVKKDQTLKKFIDEQDNVKIFVDYREKSSGIVKELIEFGVKVNLEALKSGDYLCSSRVGIEFKTKYDFVDSIIDGRLLEQLRNLKFNFERPVLIVEGEEDIFSLRKIHPNAIRGMISTIIISYGIPILYTKNFKETAAILAIIAKKEQLDEKRGISLHGDKKPSTLKEQIEYIVSALPGVGSILSKPLLRRFISLRNIANAKEDELKEVELIGDVKAKQIREIFDSEWVE